VSEQTQVTAAQENGKPEDGILRENGQLVFVADGERYVVEQFTNKDLKFAQEHLASLRKGPMDAALPEIEKIESSNLSPETKARLQAHLLDKAYPDLREILPNKKATVAWLESMDGNLWAMAHKLRKLHSNMDEDRAMEIVTKANVGQMIHKLRKHLPGLSKDEAMEILMRVGSERFHGLSEADLKLVAQKIKAEQEKEALVTSPEQTAA
jgi:hypothetical protein